MGLDQLIEKCKQHDTKARSELYQLFSSTLFSVCLKYSKNYAQAEDNLQDAFITIFNKISQYNNKGSFEGWLKRITINTTLQKYRDTKGVYEMINVDIIDDDNDVDIDADEIPLDFLLQIIQELPDRYRLVFNLYVLDGYSHKEIAEALDITTGTSKSNLARARQLLKQRIDDYNPRKFTQNL